MLAALLFLVALLLPPSAAAAPAPSAEELNAAIEPGIVQVVVTWSGYVLYDTADGQVWSELVVSSSGCSGFFVTATGHIMTAGHCVQPDGGRKDLITSFLIGQIDDGLLSEDQAVALLPDAQLNWTVEGANNGDPIIREIQVSQPGNVEGAVLDEPRNAQLVDFRSFDEGDLALLKVEATGAAALPIAAQDPRSGASLTAVGFPGSVGQVVDVNLVRASFKSGTASSPQVSASGVPQIEVNADISGGMSGGPTVDTLGNVLGVNSFGIVGEEQAFNFITDTSDLRDWLGGKNLQLAAVRSAPSADPAPVGAPLSAPAGDGGVPLWLWIVVAAAVLVAAGAVWWATVARARRRAPASTYSRGGEGGRAAWPPAGSGPPWDAQGQSWQPAGTQQLTMPANCTSCGTPGQAGSRFCAQCGTPSV